MSGIVSLALARTGYYGPPIAILMPAEDGSHYAVECHRAAIRRERPFRVLCRTHGVRERGEHDDVCTAPPLHSREDVRTLALTVRGQIGYFGGPLYVESWLWPAEERALELSRRVQVLRSPMAGMHILDRLEWLADDREES